MRKLLILGSPACLIALLIALKVHSQAITLGSSLGGIPAPPATTCPAGAQCYYFAQTGGNDTTGDGSQIRPWKSIAKAETLFSTLPCGSRLLFNGGDIWNEQFQFGDIAAHALGSSCASKPMYIGQYGVGRPVLDGQNALPSGIAYNIPTKGNPTSIVLANTTIDDFEIRHFYAYGATFQPNGSVSPGMVVSNLYIHNTGIQCSVTNGACKPITTSGMNADPPDWQAGHNYVANTATVQTIVNPSTNNAGNYWYIQSASSCHSGTSVTWPQTAGQTVSDGSPACIWTNTGVVGTYKNQLMEYANVNGNNGYHFLNNIVNNAGGHNCCQVEGDVGALLFQGNHCGPGCIHGAVDFKDVGSSGAPALALNNTVTCGYSLGQCGCNNLGSVGNDICTPDSGNCTGNNCSAVPGMYTSNVQNGGVCVSEYVQYQGNVVYDSPIGFQDQPNGVACPTSGPIFARYYNNTVYSPPSHVNFYAFYQGNANTNSTLDLRNNSFDGQRITTASGFLANSASGGFTTIQDYNNIGGKAGNISCTFNGSTCVKGHGLTNADPKYVNAAALNFDFLIGSPNIGAGLGTLTNNNNIGAYVGTGQ